MDFEKNIEPIISTAHSCQSLSRTFKNIFDQNVKFDFSNEKSKTDDNDIVVQTSTQKSQSNNSGTHKLNKLEGISESRISKENILARDNNCVERINQNALNNKPTEENKLSESEPTMFSACKESISVKRQSKVDEIPVNAKKYKSSELHDIGQLRNKDFQRHNTSPSNDVNQLYFNVPSTHIGAACSRTLTALPKRTSSAIENESSKKHSQTKSRHEKNVLHGNQNQNIDSDCQNPKIETINCDSLNNDSSLFEQAKNAQEINKVSCQINEPSVRENKWVTKSSHAELPVASALNLKCTQSTYLNKGLENHISELNHSNSDQDSMASPSSDTQWPIKLSPCNQDDLDSPESKPIINSDEQIELETPSSDTECNNSPKIENILSLRNSEEMISKLMSSRMKKFTNNENENTQIYALPIIQKETHVEHPYVENTVNSSTRDLEVVNVLSPVSISSTDMPINKNSWVPDLSLIHAPNNHNDVEGEYSQQLNGLNTLISVATSRISNHNSESENVNHTQLETPNLSKPSSFNRVEPKVYSDDSYIAVFSSSESSVSNSTYSSTYDVNRIPSAVPVKSIPVSLPLKDVMQEISNSSSGIYRKINQNFNGLNTKSTVESPSSYSFAMNTTRSTDMSTVDRLLSNDLSARVSGTISDEFSDVDSLDLRINSNEPKDTNTALNNLSMSSLISSDLKSKKIMSIFDKPSTWCLKNQSVTNPQTRNLKIYTDPTEMIPGPINLNSQPGVPVNINEGRVQKVFLGNKSPSQVYYSPVADLCVSSDVDMTNHRNVGDPQESDLKIKSGVKDHLSSTCSNDKFVPNVLPQNEPSINQTLMSGYDDTLNEVSSVMNNGFIFRFRPSSDTNLPVRYENPIQAPHKNSDCLSQHSGVTYPNFDKVLGLDYKDKKQVKDQSIFSNMAHLMLQSSKNCKVHYKWPLNKNKNQTTVSNGKVQETKSTDNELNQTSAKNNSPDEISIQNSDLSSNERQKDRISCQFNQQFQDISNKITSDLSPTVQSGSDVLNERNQNQFPAALHFESKSLNESTGHLEMMYNNSIVSNQKTKIATTDVVHIGVLDAARYLFSCGKLFLCVYPKCDISHHFRMIPSNIEILRHEYTAQYDDFRFNIQLKYKQLLTSHSKPWPNVPKITYLFKRCMCIVCVDYDIKLNGNRDMLFKYYVDEKNKITEDNNENNQPINPQLQLSWKKCLANRFSTEDITKQSMTQMLEDMERLINEFTYSFTMIFSDMQDVKTNSQNLQKICESYPDIIDSERILTPELQKYVEISHKRFTQDVCLHLYEYFDVTNGTQNYILEDPFNSPYQPPNQNVLNISHHFDEEHLSNESNRYFMENSPVSLYPSVNSSLTCQSVQYVHNNMPNTSLQPTVENSLGTLHQPPVGNLASSPHQLILNSFSTTPHGTSLDACSSLNDKSKKFSHMSRYYSDGQMYTESAHTYLQVPSSHFPTSSTNSYYGSPINMPSDNSVPFCSPSLSVPNSPSLSDCSIPSLVETVATAVPEHALLDDSYEAVNAAHNLMLISSRHRYNSTTSVTNTKTTDTITVTATTNRKTVTNTNIPTVGVSKNNTFTTDTITNNVSTTDSTTANISVTDTITNNVSTTDITMNSVQSSVTDPEDQETDIVHNSRKKKKKKHDKKKDKKKKGKR